MQSNGKQGKSDAVDWKLHKNTGTKEQNIQRKRNLKSIVSVSCPLSHNCGVWLWVRLQLVGAVCEKPKKKTGVGATRKMVK